jgi:hypothetical protein
MKVSWIIEQKSRVSYLFFRNTVQDEKEEQDVKAEDHTSEGLASGRGGWECARVQESVQDRANRFLYWLTRPLVSLLAFSN